MAHKRREILEYLVQHDSDKGVHAHELCGALRIGTGRLYTDLDKLLRNGSIERRFLDEYWPSGRLAPIEHPGSGPGKIAYYRALPDRPTSGKRRRVPPWRFGIRWGTAPQPG